MITKINRINIDWTDIKNKCRTTVGKKYTENSPSDKFKVDLLISEHSPIRLGYVDWTWGSIKSWVATHFSRHKWECFISTQRSDRTNVDRDNSPQGTEVILDGNANIQNLIDTSRKRLCFCSSKETREHWEDLKVEISKREPIVSDVLVPNCIYRCGCPEFQECGFWTAFKKNNPEADLTEIRERYRLYNESFNQRVGK